MQISFDLLHIRYYILISVLVKGLTQYGVWLSDQILFCLIFVLCLSYFKNSRRLDISMPPDFCLICLAFFNKTLSTYISIISLYFFTINFIKNSKTSKTNRYRPRIYWSVATIKNKTNTRHDQTKIRQPHFLSPQKNFTKNRKTSKTNRYRPRNTQPAAIFKNKTNTRQKLDIYKIVQRHQKWWDTLLLLIHLVTDFHLKKMI